MEWTTLNQETELNIKMKVFLVINEVILAQSC